MNKKLRKIIIPEYINKGNNLWAFVDWATEKDLDLYLASDSEFDKYLKMFQKELRI